MPRYALAIDMGASSGRHVLGWIQDGKVMMEEIYRFPNGIQEKDGRLCWDVDALFGHIVEGMKKCAELHKIPDTVGIDTWGVDYVLLDREGKRLGDAVAYRDNRTKGKAAELESRLPFADHYRLTGTALQPYNTVYQLMAELSAHPERRESASRLLFLPCYFSYRLCGVACNEYTIASTSGLLNAESRDWEPAVLAAAEIPRELPGEKPVVPGTLLGPLLPEVRRHVGFDCQVMLVGAHDTASAFFAVPETKQDSLLLSSGTWSLLGAKLSRPALSLRAMEAGFTNEGGVDCVRFLKNIMGLWLLQELRREWPVPIGYDEMTRLAEAGNGYRHAVDVTDSRFLKPACMRRELLAALEEQGAPLPGSDAELLYCVNHSLAISYGQAVKKLEEILGKTFSGLLILGGGNQNHLLNRLTEQETGLPVEAGPTEGSAMGNLNLQLLGALGAEKERGGSSPC